jgi:uncharacterized protein YebE (UPF0316 family)
MADALRTIGFGVTEFSGQGRDGRVEIVHTVCMRRDVERVVDEIERWDRQAFITVEEPRDIRWGWMQTIPRNRMPMGISAHRMMRNMSERLKRAGRAGREGG